MAGFVPLLLQSSPQNAQRLDVFRTQTLITILPVDKKERAANAEIDEILDSTIGMNIDSIVVTDLPTVNSRAGLYIYLNSLVSGYLVMKRPSDPYLLSQLVARPLIDDSAIFAYLHNRYQVSQLCSHAEPLLTIPRVMSNQRQ